jgi:hypothetical protein
MNNPTQANATGVNHNLVAIGAIKHVSEFVFPPPDVNLEAVRIMAIAALAHVGPLRFPDAEAGKEEVGRFIAETIQVIFNASGPPDDHSPMFAAAEAQTADGVRALVTGKTEVIAILTNAVRKFLESANKYHDSRVASARVQMQADGCTAEQIAAVTDDPLALRAYIANRRAALIAHLEIIQVKIDNNDPMEMATQKEVALFAKHRRWFVDEEDENDEYLPNDNAVSYPVLAFEIILNLSREGEGDVAGLIAAFNSFCDIARNALGEESSTAAYQTLGRVPDLPVGGFNVGKAIRDYVTFGPRNVKCRKAILDPKLQTATQRGPRRLQRIIACFRGGQSQFTIMNLPVAVSLKHLVELDRREKAASAAVSRANNVGPGALGLSDAESMMWLMFLGRNAILETVTGRNDLSLPAICGALTGFNTNAFGALEARPWAIDTDLF